MTSVIPSLQRPLIPALPQRVYDPTAELDFMRALERTPRAPIGLRATPGAVLMAAERLTAAERASNARLSVQRSVIAGKTYFHVQAWRTEGDKFGLLVFDEAGQLVARSQRGTFDSAVMEPRPEAVAHFARLSDALTRLFATPSAMRPNGVALKDAPLPRSLGILITAAHRVVVDGRSYWALVDENTFIHVYAEGLKDASPLVRVGMGTLGKRFELKVPRSVVHFPTEA